MLKLEVKLKPVFMKIALFVISAFFILGCTTNNDMPTADNGLWTLGVTQYKIVSTQRSDPSGYFVLTGTDPQSPSNSLNLYFSSRPTSSGKFNVVKFEGNPQLGTNQIGIKVIIPSTGIYSSTGISDNISWSSAQPADVIVQNGKISVSIPQMTTIIRTPTYLDTVFIQASINE